MRMTRFAIVLSGVFLCAAWLAGQGTGTKPLEIYVVDTEGGLFLRTEDLARIGVLFLHDGEWNGKRIVSSAWIKKSVTPRIDAGEGFKYGYYWWLLPYGHGQMAWMARGFGGQRLMLFPDERLIVTSTAWHILDDSSLEFDVIKRLLPGVHAHRCDGP